MTMRGTHSIQLGGIRTQSFNYYYLFRYIISVKSKNIMQIKWYFRFCSLGIDPFFNEEDFCKVVVLYMAE